MASIEGLLRWPLTEVVWRGSWVPLTPSRGLISRKASITTLPRTDWIGSITTATHLGFSCSKDCWMKSEVLECWYLRWRASSRTKDGNGTSRQQLQYAWFVWACPTCLAGRLDQPITRWLTYLIVALRRRLPPLWRSHRSPHRSGVPSPPRARLLGNVLASLVEPETKCIFVRMCRVWDLLTGCLVPFFPCLRGLPGRLDLPFQTSLLNYFQINKLISADHISYIQSNTKPA